MTDEKQDEKELVSRIVRNYLDVRLKPLEKTEFSASLRGCGVSPWDYLHSFGLYKEIYLPFLQAIADKGIDVSKEADILDIPLDRVSYPNLLENSIENFKVEMENGNNVSLIGYQNSPDIQKGRFVTGFYGGLNVRLRYFAFASEKNHNDHRLLAAVTIPTCNIIEAGFAEIQFNQKMITLSGKSDGFGLYPGQISLNLLRRALPNWTVRRGY